MLTVQTNTSPINDGRTKKHFHPAFTIVELLIVVVVIAIIATISLVAYRGIQDRAETAVLESDLTLAAKQLAMDNATDGFYPSDHTIAGGGSGLAASSGTVYEYTADSTGYCLSAVRGDRASHVTNVGSPQEGVCPGHSGPVVGGGSSLTCESGFIPVSGNSLFGTSDFCVSKYEAKNVGGVAKSQAADTPWVGLNQTDAMARASEACASCRLISEAEWLTIAHDIVGVASNWGPGPAGVDSLYKGHGDNTPSNSLAASSDDSNGYEGTGNTSGMYGGDQRRTLTLSNGEVIWDLSGNVSEWTSGQVSGAGNQPGGASLAWNDWKDIVGTGNLSPNPFPSYGTPAASSWSWKQGIGRIWSSSSETRLRAFSRGGYWNGGSSGLFGLDLTRSPNLLSGGLYYSGFRVTHN